MDAQGDYAGLYCCFMVLTGSFLLLQLFVGVISSAFVSIEEKRKKEIEMLTDIRRDGVANVAEKSETNFAEQLAAKKLKRALAAKKLKSSGEGDNEALLPPHIPRSAPKRRSSIVIIKDAVQSLRLSDRIQALVSSDYFVTSMLCAVVFNVVVMCLPYHGMSERYASALESTSSAITWLFICEMVLKLAGLGYWQYWSESSNVLDGCLVITSVVEMVIACLVEAFLFTNGRRRLTPSPSPVLFVPPDPRIIAVNGRWRSLKLTNATACSRLPYSSPHQSVE